MADFPRIQNLLSIKEVLGAYKVVSQLHPYHPSVVLWRVWEYAAYQRHTLDEPALDMGCGDGLFFRLVWPHIRDVIGLDIDVAVAEAAKRSGVYREVHVVPSYDLPFESNRFASVFANCSLEHMDQLPEVFRQVSRCLRPGGKFLFSVTTDKLLEWTPLPLLLRLVGETARGEFLQSEYVKYHHLVQQFSPKTWAGQLAKADLTVEDYIPIVPEFTARLFLFLDQLWHIPYGGQEVGDRLPAIFASWPNFNSGLEQILSGFLSMERDWATCGGAVFCARKFTG